MNDMNFLLLCLLISLIIIIGVSCAVIQQAPCRSGQEETTIGLYGTVYLRRCKKPVDNDSEQEEFPIDTQD